MAWPNNPTGRLTTYTPASPVKANDLNSLQDALINNTHGDRVLEIPGNACVATNANIGHNFGYVQTSGATSLIYPIALRQGDRIKSVTYAMAGDGVADFTATDVRKISTNGTNTLLTAGGAVNNQGAAVVDKTIDVAPDYTLVAGDTIFLVLTANAGNLQVYNVRVTYDHP